MSADAAAGDFVTRLKKLDCCAVSDALDKLHLKGAVTGLTELVSSGGILTLGAKLRGVAGVIADGPVRDIDEARQHDFPVFGKGVTTFTARGRIVELSTGEPIRVGEIPVKPGDYVIADGSGVVFISAENIERVLAAAEEIFAREAAMAQALREGKPITEVMGANYENMLRN